jgi:hypothetical protein
MYSPALRRRLTLTLRSATVTSLQLDRPQDQRFRLLVLVVLLHCLDRDAPVAAPRISRLVAALVIRIGGFREEPAAAVAGLALMAQESQDEGALLFVPLGFAGGDGPDD